jgi:hypothetical protein
VVKTPLLVFESMEHMKVQIQQLVLHGRAQAYHKAIQQNPFYCHKPDRLTKCLRAELMDPCQAAVGMVRHLETKHELFGVGKLAKDITQDDLEEEPDGIPTLYTKFCANRTAPGEPFPFGVARHHSRIVFVS